MSKLSDYIILNTQLAAVSVKNTLKLLNKDCTIPFIARYRKEQTANLNEVEIGAIVKYKEQFETIEKRKTSILKALTEDKVLTNTLKERIEHAQDLITLEDIYLPFKKKRKTKADIAIKNGLEPLAKQIMSQRTDDIEYIAYNYLNTTITNEDLALEGARHIIAQWINEHAHIRNNIRHQLQKYAIIITKVVKDKKLEESAQKYLDYFDWKEPLNRIPSHRLLAILRAEKEGVIKIKIEIDNARAIDKMEYRLIKSNNACAKQIALAIKDAYKRLLLPSLANEALQNAKQKADEAAIDVFSKNLKQLLLGSPLGEKRILAIDPGYRTGCKLVCLNEHGKLLYNETIYPHAPKNESKSAIKKINSLTNAYKIDAIAIGNGTASRETERLIRTIKFKNNVQVFVVSEAGASIYSVSKIAREEFPNYDVTVRGAVSIGRRLADPLAELVKIDPKSIGVGQYQHDVDQTKLKKSLDTVVESCVNAVGVNINTASKYLLSYVSGIGPKLAENIIAYRNKNGAFTTREAIKKVPRLGNKAFEQGAGFLRVKGGENPLDDSAVHPERYTLVNKIAKNENKTLTNLIRNKTTLQAIKLEPYCNAKIGLPTLKDIINELEKPGLDIRQKAKVFTFNQNIKTITDLQTGQLLPGIVNNITNFGCFVDIGIKESGLIHISNLAEGFVSNVSKHVHLHEKLIVKVLAIDVDRKRIQLKLHKKV